MEIAGWIIGILLILIGLAWLCGLFMFRPLHKAEIEMMKQDGKFEDEPDYMQNFRVMRSEFDLEANTGYIAYATLSLSLGITIIILLIVF